MASTGVLALTTADRQALIPMAAGYLIWMSALGFGLYRLYRPRGAASGAAPPAKRASRAGHAARPGPAAGHATEPGPAHRPGRAAQAGSHHRHMRVRAADGGHRGLLLRRRAGRLRFPGERAHRHGAPGRARDSGLRRPVLAGRTPWPELTPRGPPPGARRRRRPPGARPVPSAAPRSKRPTPDRPPTSWMPHSDGSSHLWGPRCHVHRGCSAPATDGTLRLPTRRQVTPSPRKRLVKTFTKRLRGNGPPFRLALGLRQRMAPAWPGVADRAPPGLLGAGQAQGAGPGDRLFPAVDAEPVVQAGRSLLGCRPGDAQLVGDNGEGE